MNPRISTIRTARLTLRQWLPEDFEAYAAWCADIDVMRYLTGREFTRLESYRHLAFLVGHWQLKGFGHWAVEENKSGAVIGRLGFIHPEGDWPGFEIGWVLAKAYWGNGYATEGAKAALQVAFEEMNKKDVISIIHPENTASQRLAARLGETYRSNTESNGVNMQIWGIDKETYLGLNPDHR